MRATPRCLVVTVIALCACAPPGHFPPTDAGNGSGDGNGGTGGDSGGAGKDGQAPDAGGKGGGAGDCTKPDGVGFAGCRFYPVDLDQYQHHDKINFVIAAGNPGAIDTATVTLEAKSGSSWSALATATVPPGTAQVFERTDDRHVERTGIGAGLAYRLKSDQPVVVYQFNPPFEAGGVVSSGASLLVTASAWGREYFILTNRGVDPLPPVPGAPTSGRPAGYSYLTIVAGQDGAKVEVTASAATVAGGGVPALTPGETFTATLEEGDVVQIAADSHMDDLSGSHIVSDRPIQVFGGTDATAAGLIGNVRGDHTEEPSPHIGTWGKVFVATRVQNENNNSNAPSDLGQSRFQVLAAEDGTEVAFDGPLGLPLPAKMTLGRGKWEAFHLDPQGATPAAGGFLISANKPIQVLQTSQMKSSSVRGVPVEQFLDDFFFVTLSFFKNNWITVVRKVDQPVFLDGGPLDKSLFRPAGGGFEVAEVALSACPGKGNVCPHRVAGKEVLVLVFADDFCAYGYVGAMGHRCINKGTVGCD